MSSMGCTVQRTRSQTDKCTTHATSHISYKRHYTNQYVNLVQYIQSTTLTIMPVISVLWQGSVSSFLTAHQHIKAIQCLKRLTGLCPGLHFMCRGEGHKVEIGIPFSASNCVCHPAPPDTIAELEKGIPFSNSAMVSGGAGWQMQFEAKEHTS